MFSTKEIEIANVEQELAKLGAEGKKKGQMKGCLFNLILYSQDLERLSYLKEIVQTVTETFPCRIIFIECHPESRENFLKVNVEEEIVKKNGSSISCDRINIQCTPKYLNRVSTLVVPYFVPDLPIYLLWGQDPSQENAILPFLQTFATRLIFDSDSSSDIRSFCRKMLTDDLFKKIPITDMNWASLASWRSILLQIFDSQEQVEQLRNCKQMVIRYNCKMSPSLCHTERRAIYLQAWIAAQLGWIYDHVSLDQSTVKIIYKNPSGLVEISIVGESLDFLLSGAIFGVEIYMLNETVFNLRRMSAQPFIIAYISLKDRCELPFALPLRHHKKGLNFMNEIFFVPCSSHYWNMLKTLECLQISC